MSHSKSDKHHRQNKQQKKSSSHRQVKTRVFACGYNYNYQFGLENNDNYSSDIIELEWCRGLNISYICSGLTHLCYLSFSGNYYFCGQIDTEKLGMIENRKNMNAVIQKSRSSLDLNNMRITRIADGVSSRHIIVISKDLKAYSLGSNQRGQLGLGHFKSTIKFNRVQFKKSKSDLENLVSFDIIDASCGESHSAFVVMPKCKLKITRILNYYSYRYRLRINDSISRIIYKYVEGEPKGRLYVCGCNNFGQLGLGNEIKECLHIPHQVTENGLSSVSIAQVSCGENHTICLDNRGRVYCFGDNYYGQSGAHLNHYENVYYPIRIEHFKKQYQAKIVKVSSGKYHCVALDKLGRVFCWGLGAYGQLGGNKLNKRVILPIFVESLTDKKIVDVRCGIYHTIALTNKGQLYCWGSNNYGQCFQNVNQENIITPKLAKIDTINQQNLLIYKVFCGYYSTLILTVDASANAKH